MWNHKSVQVRSASWMHFDHHTSAMILVSFWQQIKAIRMYRETFLKFYDCSFDSKYVEGFGSLAQLVEHRTFNPLAAGSNPA